METIRAQGGKPVSEERRVIRDKKTLRACYPTLKAGDVILGRVFLRPSEENMLVDLMSRGVLFFPSALAHMASRSKTFQVPLFVDYMFPHTLAIHDRHDLVKAISYYSENTIAKVVTKSDRDNGGRGIHLWNSIEDVFSQASFGVLPYPFVLQPFYEAGRDVRIIVLDGYREAYSRHNPYNFRNNLFSGGESTPYEITSEQWSVCCEVMERGRFPHAHIDITVMDDDTFYLGEINLYGGIKGAQINQEEYQERVKAIYDGYLNEG